MSNRFFLRDLTMSQHRQLEAEAAVLSLGDAAGYRAYLSWQARVIPAAERALEAGGVLMLLPDWTRRERQAALLADLAAAGAARDSEASVGPLHGAQLWGVAYVLEGSRLGGELLRRDVVEPYRSIATAFLSHGRGERLWQSFAGALDAAPLSASELDQAAVAAAELFETFRRALPPVVALAG